MTSLADPARRIGDAADELEGANGELVAFLRSLTEEQWRVTGTTQAWPVVALAYHVADGYRIHMRWLDLIRRARPVPGTPADLDAENARAVADGAELPPAVVLSAVQTGGRLLVAYIHDLAPEELVRSAPHGPLGGEHISVDFMLDLASWHVREHLGSMRGAVGS